MKHITFLYRNHSNLQEFSISSDEDGVSLFNSILDARDKDKKTLLITFDGNYKMIDPTEIIDLNFTHIDSSLGGAI